MFSLFKCSYGIAEVQNFRLGSRYLISRGRETNFSKNWLRQRAVYKHKIGEKSLLKSYSYSIVYTIGECITGNGLLYFGG